MSAPVVPVTPVATPAQATTQVPQGGGTEIHEGGSAQPKPQTAAEDFHEIKIDGKVEKLSLSEMKRLVSISKASEKRFEEAARMKREAESVLERTQDPKKYLAALKKSGLDKAQIQEALDEFYMREFIEPEQMSPEQRELAQAKERLREYEERETQEKETKAKTEEEQMDAEARRELQAEIIAIIEESGLPKSKFVVNRIAHWTRVNEMKGLRAPRELIIQQVQKESREIWDTHTKAMSGAQIAERLGDENLRKVREHLLTQIRSARGQNAPQIAQPTPVSPQEKIRPSEVRRRMREFR